MNVGGNAEESGGRGLQQVLGMACPVNCSSMVNPRYLQDVSMIA